MTKLDALKAIADGINALIEMEENNTDVVALPQKPVKEEKTESVESTEVAEQENDVDVESMDYRQLKSYAAKLGVSAKGTKGQLVKAVKEFLANGSEEAEETEEDVAPVEKKRGVKALKPSTGKADKEAEEEDEEEAEAEVEEEANSTIAEVEKAIAEQELTDDDLRDILKDLGLSTKGGHEVLVSKLADAVDAGELSLDDDESDGEDESDGSDVVDRTSESEDESDDEEDEEADDDSEEITEERKSAVEEFDSDTREAFEAGEITVSDMRDFIKEFGEKISKKASDEEVLDKYIECASLLIDDEGNTVEEGAYMLNGEPFCCGHTLEISEDGTTGKCSICGEEYEFEE